MKQPLHTTIAVDTLEFGEFSVEEKLRIVISVKDFKAVVAHASISNTMVKALYSRPSNPMELTYSDGGVFSEFIFMTIGESRSASATPAPNASRAGSKRPASRQALESHPDPKRTATSMPPPPMSVAPSINRGSSKPKPPRSSPPPPQPTFQSQSLFIPEGDDDEKWNPVNFDEDDDEMLLWDVGGEKVRQLGGLTENYANCQKNAAPQAAMETKHNGDDRATPLPCDSDLPPTQRIAPTQRVSQVRMLLLWC